MNLAIVVGEGASKPMPSDSIRNLEPFVGSYLCPHQKGDIMETVWYCDKRCNLHMPFCIQGTHGLVAHPHAHLTLFGHDQTQVGAQS